jgi:hypothetical protein
MRAGGNHHSAWGAGAAGFAAGALLGSALAPRPHYYYDYGPPAYAYEPGPAYDDAEANRGSAPTTRAAAPIWARTAAATPARDGTSVRTGANSAGSVSIAPAVAARFNEIHRPGAPLTNLPTAHGTN